MRARTVVVVGLGLLVAGALGCSSEPDVVPAATTTSTAAARVEASTTTSSTAPGVPEAAAAPGEMRRRHVPLRPRLPRQPRITRAQTRAHLAEELARRRPGYTFTPGELDQLTNKAMQIRVTRGRIERMARLRPAAMQTPRGVAMRARLQMLTDDFQARAGVPAADVPAILEMKPPPAPAR
jgi:hypothetical protein